MHVHPHGSRRRWWTVGTVAVALGGLGIVGTGSAGPVFAMPPRFPPDVAQAMAWAARRTRVPVLGPVWVPAFHIRGRTFAATVVAKPAAYQIEFWREWHLLPPNSPKVDSTDPALEPLVSVGGTRESSPALARHVVTTNAFDQIAGLQHSTRIPPAAQTVAITPTIRGRLWSHGSHGGRLIVTVIAWHERGWLVVTYGPSLSRSKTAQRQAAIAEAQQQVPKIMAAMPGQWGTICVAPAGTGDHTFVAWQRGTIVYSVYCNNGISGATTVVASLYPYRPASAS